MKTIAEMPADYSGEVHLVLNDKCFDAVARDAIMLLVALTVKEDEAVSAIIQLWYSAFITEAHANILARIRLLIETAVKEANDTDDETVLQKTFNSGARSLQLSLDKEQWDRLLSFRTVRDDLSAQEAKQIRSAVTLAAGSLDNRESKHMFCSGPRRVCGHRFDEDGILLPFGHSKYEYCIVNPYVLFIPLCGYVADI